MKLFRRLVAAVGLAGAIQAGPVAADEPRDCMALRKANGWSRAEFKECKLAEAQKRIDLLGEKFERMRTWLQARGLDINDAGHIIDTKGRTLAVIEAQNSQMKQSNANLEQSNAALRASIAASEDKIKVLDNEYANMMSDFRSFLNDRSN